MERSWTISGVCGLRKRPGVEGGGETGRAEVFRLDRIGLRRYFLFWFCGTNLRSAVILQCDLSVRLKSDLVIGLTSTLFYKLLEGFSAVGSQAESGRWKYRGMDDAMHVEL